MQVHALKTPLIKPKDNIVNALLQAIEKHNLKLEEKDIIVIASKVLAIAQGRVIKLNQISESRKAKTLAQIYLLKPQFVELILHEAEQIYGGVEKAILTLKDGILTVNAGIDHKNAPADHAALWPLEPHQQAEDIRNRIKKKTGKNVGVLIMDSQVAPLRMGTRGLALAASGFKPVKDYRKEYDLFGKPLLITRHAIADDLASSAHLLMGESNEKIPFVLIKNAPVTFTDKRVSSEEMQIQFEKCVYTSALNISAA
ncbi:MAG: coenzyme F420-0:L-glutamate ligase [Candidatus Bathyarchaeota archaeon]|nr:MAG: coenzyme F420-0:L-glutamate ligase [Candidatus Bathyarchaeota archaeon]